MKKLILNDNGTAETALGKTLFEDIIDPSDDPQKKNFAYLFDSKE